MKTRSFKAWQIEGGFGLERLTFTELPAKEALGPREVRIAVRALSLNYRDLLVARGHYDPRLPLPHVPLSDCAGEVVEVGGEVTRVAVGDRVSPTFAPEWEAGRPNRARLRAALGGGLPGVAQEERVFEERSLCKVPAHLSWVEAASLVCAGHTAWSALVEEGEVRAGEVVLIQGSGGVSVFALQIAKLLGARVIATSSSEAKRARLIEMGAEHAIDYRADERWGRTAKKLAGGEGIDHVVEVGGAGTLAQSMAAVRPGGAISVIGVLSGVAEKTNLLPILMNQVRLQGIMVGHRDGYERMARAFEAAKLRPVIDRVFPFAELPDALRYLESGKHFGKVGVEL